MNKDGKVDDSKGPDARKQYAEFELLGVVKDKPEFREFASGTCVARGYVSCRKNRKDKDTGEWRAEYMGWGFDVWNDLGREFLARIAAKDAVLLRGRLKVESWEDKATGARREKTVLDVTEFELISHEVDRMNRGKQFEDRREAAQKAKDGLAKPEIEPDDDPF